MKLPRRWGRGMLSVLLAACVLPLAAAADKTHLTIATGLAPTVPTN